MKSYVVRCGISAAVLWGCGVSNVGRAQAVPEQHVIASMREQPSMMSQAVTLRLQNALLKDALAAVEKAAKIKIYYQVELINAVGGPVSVRAESWTLRSVLDALLVGTGLRAAPVSNGIVTIEPSGETTLAENGTVVGKVIHAKTKQPVPGAKVTIDDGSEAVITGEDGGFRITVPEGGHSVNVRSVGFIRRSTRITVGSGQVVSLDIAIEPSASVLDEVVVTGTVVATERKAITTPITVITADEIERRGITRIEQLFRGEVPGVFVLETGTAIYGDKLGAMNTSTIYSRGSSSLEVDVLGKTPTPLKTFIDGVELLDATYLGTIDPQSIERIEVITGPQAATIYGSGAMGGVMQIFTKKGNAAGRAELNLSLQYGIIESNVSSGRTPMHVHTAGLNGGSGPGFSYSASLSHNYSGQWRPFYYSRRYGVSIGATHQTGPVTVTGSVSATAGNSGTGGGSNGTIGAWEGAQAGIRYAQDYSHYISQRISRSSSQTISLNIDYRALRYWQHRFTVGRSATAFSLDPQSPKFSYTGDTLFRSEESQGARTTVGYNTTFVSPRLGVVQTTWTVGLNGSTGNQVTYRGSLISESSTAFQAPKVTKSVASESWGGFGTVQLGLMERLYFTFGLRAERNPSYGQKHTIDWTPTNGAAFMLDAGPVTIKLLGSYGKATRAPSPEMRDVAYGSLTGFVPERFINTFEAPNLTPEYERGPQGGVEVYYSNIGSVSINHYSQTVTDLIQRLVVDSVELTSVQSGCCRMQPQYQYQNVATIKKRGWEAMSTINIGVLSFRGTYSWNDSRIIRLGIGQDGIGLPFRYIPTHTGNMTVGYAHKATMISVIMNWVGRRRQNVIDGPYYQNNLSNTRLPMYTDVRICCLADWNRPGYIKSDLAASQHITPWVSVTLNVSNLGNSFGSEVGVNKRVMGRQTRLGLRFRTR